MSSVIEIQKRIDELKARKAKLAAWEKSRVGKVRRQADTTVKILAGSILLKRWPNMIFDVADHLEPRDQKRFADALHVLGHIDKATCEAISGV